MCMRCGFKVLEASGLRLVGQRQLLLMLVIKRGASQRAEDEHVKGPTYHSRRYLVGIWALPRSLYYAITFEAFGGMAGGPKKQLQTCIHQFRAWESRLEEILWCRASVFALLRPGSPKLKRFD